jgi:hypothetical protein
VPTILCFHLPIFNYGDIVIFKDFWYGWIFLNKALFHPKEAMEVAPSAQLSNPPQTFVHNSFLKGL